MSVFQSTVGGASRRIIVALLLGLPATSVRAQESAAPPVVGADSALERRTREVAAALRCPVCQGLSIADSPSDLALEMKGLVREQLAAGKSPEEIRAYFIDKYGEWVLLEPKAEGLNLLVYVLPVALVVGGGLFVVRYVRANSTEKKA
ncbi:MAG: cytochrome c-type biogenesis protein CcmH [Gemmatimonadetes bacterium]|nr:cytochrome c-type biogenesis protein CcmH [Gemmatimonadota bacterium]